MTYSNCSNISNSTLTSEKLKEMMKQITEYLKNVPDDGLQEFAKKHGFDLDNGDLMVIPKGFAEAHDISPRYGVQFTELIDCSIFFIRNGNMPYQIKHRKHLI